MQETEGLEEIIAALGEARFGLIDLLPGFDRLEKLVGLALNGPPPAPVDMAAKLSSLALSLNATDTREVRMVVFGGGTGLSNILGGDSRNPLWPNAPFHGLKEIFPRIRAVVCITDDGGSSGELLKELPLIALGDIRHVLLSAVCRTRLQEQYGLDEALSLQVCRSLHALFNYRFETAPFTAQQLAFDAGVKLEELPDSMGKGLSALLEMLLIEPRLRQQLHRPHCLGNLLLAAAIIGEKNELAGIARLALLLGVEPEAVLPCTTTPARLKMLYGNGVLVSGEYKSGKARRGYPVDRVFVEFAARPQVPPQVLDAISEADIIVFAPGSLFTSIVPILQVPGIAQAIRGNQGALKMLVANLWAQAGETDMIAGDYRQRYHVSDLLAAYQRNIPGGVNGLFDEILVLGLGDIPGSILQRYALENKVPIYLDREMVLGMGFSPVEARLFSQVDIEQRRVIQHDPASLAVAVRAMWALRSLITQTRVKKVPGPTAGAGPELLLDPLRQTANVRFAAICQRLRNMDIPGELLPFLYEIMWRHGDIPLAHLDMVSGIALLPPDQWSQSQKWDSVYSFYDPLDGFIKIRRDISDVPEKLEAGFLVALGQSLLGNYVAQKEKLPLERDGVFLGYEFCLVLREEEDRRCFFRPEELALFLSLVRMRRAPDNPCLYTRLVNGDEGFTPPGLLFGLTYAWYLDNRHVGHIEYKMSINRLAFCGLIPEQKKLADRRQALIDFFRGVVFRYRADEAVRVS